MAVILDTNALSAFADGQESLRQAIQSEDDLFIPVIVLGEYLFGIRQSRHRARLSNGSRPNSPFSRCSKSNVKPRRDMQKSGRS